MNSKRLYELADCTEYRQTLLARPPRLVRATVVLLVMLVTAAVLWAARTDADLVVRAPGRVRPMVRIERLADSAGEESSVSPSRDGRGTVRHCSRAVAHIVTHSLPIITSATRHQVRPYPARTSARTKARGSGYPGSSAFGSPLPGSGSSFPGWSFPG